MKKIIIVFKSVKNPYTISSKAETFGLKEIPKGHLLLLTSNINAALLLSKLGSDIRTFDVWFKEQVGHSDASREHLETLKKIKTAFELHKSIKMDPEFLEKTNAEFSLVLKEKYKVQSKDIIIMDLE